jgi:tetratricopeptide (TPR) repeat protein
MQAPAQAQKVGFVNDWRQMKASAPPIVWCLLALLPGLLLRADWWQAFSATPLFLSPAIDEGLHLAWAQRLAAGLGSPEIPFFRAPLYPWWLGGLSRAGLDVAGLRLAGLLTGLLGLGLLAGLAWRRLEAGARPWLLLLIGSSGAWIYFEPMLLIVHWLIVWLLAALWLHLIAVETGRRRWAAAAGLALGLAAISRPTALLLLPVLLWPAAAERLQGLGAWRRRALAGLLALALPLAAVGWINGWPSSGVLIASQGGVNLWIGNNPQADGHGAALPGVGGAWERADATAEASAALGRPATPGEESRWYARRALGWMTDDPLAAARGLLLKTARLLAPAEAGNNTSPGALAAGAPLFGPWLGLGWWPLLLPGLAGLALGFPRHRELRRICGWGLLVYGAGIVLFFVNSRFRLPLLPLLALPAAELLQAMLRRWVWTLRRTWRAGSGGAEPPALLIHRWRLGLLLLLLAAPLAAHLALRPGDPQAHTRAAAGWQAFQLGNAWWRLQQADSAAAAWNRALELAPALPEVRLNLGLPHMNRHPARAGSLFRAELELDPGSAKAWNNLGSLQLQVGETARAAAAFQRALSLRPGLEDAAWNLGLTHCRLGMEAWAAGDSLAATAALKAAQDTPYRGPSLERLRGLLAGR